MNYLLFTTTMCPKCPAVKEFITNNISFPGEILDNNSSDFMKQAATYDITQAPTLIIRKDNNEIFRGSEIPEIQSFLSSI
ncbi:hypothetical protein COB57_01940 [Candidatus Peregrinibacteria bacterium]|nr:MAG: hypothetical protein COB57_01940 [Candidatus Peregrinibacteria bacterium]